MYNGLRAGSSDVKTDLNFHARCMVQCLYKMLESTLI